MAIEHFGDLPNEIILTIASLLDIIDLIRCAQVSRRIRSICHNESLWQKINLCFKRIPSEFIEYIMANKGCKYISLRTSKIWISEDKNLNLDQNLPLKYLNLDFCAAKSSVLTNLISACDSLEKLSLRDICLTKEIINAIR